MNTAGWRIHIEMENERWSQYMVAIPDQSEAIRVLAHALQLDRRTVRCVCTPMFESDFTRENWAGEQIRRVPD